MTEKFKSVGDKKERKRERERERERRLMLLVTKRQVYYNYNGIHMSWWFCTQWYGRLPLGQVFRVRILQLLEPNTMPNVNKQIGLIPKDDFQAKQKSNTVKDEIASCREECLEIEDNVSLTCKSR